MRPARRCNSSRRSVRRASRTTARARPVQPLGVRYRTPRRQGRRCPTRLVRCNPFRRTRLDGHRLGNRHLVGRQSASGVQRTGHHQGDDRFLDDGARFACGRSAALRRAAVDGAGRTDRGRPGGSNRQARIQQLPASAPPGPDLRLQRCGFTVGLQHGRSAASSRTATYYNCPFST